MMRSNVLLPLPLGPVTAIAAGPRKAKSSDWICVRRVP
jgi:hypothetical protein